MVFSYEHLISKSDEVHTPLNQVSKKTECNRGSPGQQVGEKVYVPYCSI